MFKNIFNQKREDSIKNIGRTEFVEMVNSFANILELGPFHSPITTSHEAKYFDILSQEGLKQRAQDIGVPDRVGHIPPIHFISPTGDLSIVKEKFDAITSSHVIEHQLDFVGHINKVSNLLKPDGKYFLIIPDKRYCFDHFNPESTIAEIVHWSQISRKKHDLKSVIEHRALTTHNDPVRHWDGDHGTIENKAERIKASIAEYNTGEYIDVHAWYFNPVTFEIIINDLNELDMVEMEVEAIYPTLHGTFEFFAVLKKK